MSDFDSQQPRFQHSRKSVIVNLVIVTLLVALVGGFLLICRLAKKGGDYPIARMRIEIDGLSKAMETYKTELGEYPPSDPADAEQHLRQAFPRYTGEMKVTFSGPDEALHFWLGGPDGDGFCANPEDPFQPNEDRNHNGRLDPGEDANGNGVLEGSARIGPFYEFDPDRLKGHVYKPRLYRQRATSDPYVYVRADEDGNYTGPSGSCSPFPGVNPKSHQIHCPGLDGKFGSGGTLTDSTGYTKERWDDMGNFCDFTLEDNAR